MELQPHEWRIIAHALLAVSKSGGGSSQYHLFRKIAEEKQIELDVSLLAHYQKIAHSELQEIESISEARIDKIFTDEEMETIRQEMNKSPGPLLPVLRSI